ncbi:S9 family peptidase [Occallatibacter riparius]|uniref:Prolyl oligopeptidase family serine peptidase n=1 Tax=Occallatibacter riparius TaxID=1002689 RepID=A0A9J7BX26_9BACT|nr:prolyl oligopeptidase family serine peptidase [Occallatibacter riparius]UWZ86402.1 prolyl oligopeptidase family serine peptidase [Occallatibacter riparius]
MLFSRFFPASLSLCAVLTVVPLARAADKSAEPHFPTSEDLRHLKGIGGPQLSPDGKQILFVVTDTTADGAKSHIWIVAASGDKDSLRQLTVSPPADKRGERAPQWAPDGSAIFFLAHRNDHTQLFRLDLRGGEAMPYDLKVMPVVDESKAKNAIPPPGAEKKDKKADDKKPEEKPESKKDEPLAIDINGYATSSDGKMLAVWARDPETPGEKKQKDAKADATWVNHDEHGTRLYLAALKANGQIDGELKVTSVAPDVRSATWSPVDNRLLVTTEPPNDLSDLGPAGEAFLLDAATPDKPQKLSAIPPTIGRADFTPDANTIVFAAATPEDAPPGYDELFALPKRSSGEQVIRLSAGFVGQLNGQALYVTPDGTLIAQAGIGVRTTPVRLTLDGSKPPQPIDLGAPVITGLNTNRKQTGWVWLAESGGQPEKLCTAAKLGDACTALPIPELAPADLRSVEPELVKWQSGEFTIEGLLYMPAQAKSGKVPLIVDVHGGPFGAFENRHDPFADFLVGHGWAVLRPNPRGSSNYGVKFAAANKNDLGGGDYQDIMAGVDYSLAHYPLDASKMALMGYSYGGEMAGFVEGKTDRFKAIISGAPVIDQFSEYGTEGGSWYDRWYFGKPWEHMQDAWKQSPLSGAARAKTPFLILQGEADTTDPLGQAQEMYRALRQEGVPVELVTYPRDNHGPLAGAMFGRPVPEPWHGYDARQRVIEFLNKAFGVSEDK